MLTNVNIHIIVQEVISKIYDLIPTTLLDELSAEICISKGTDNYEYMTLGSRIITSNHHKNTNECFIEKLKILKIDNKISDELIDIAEKHKDIIIKTIDYNKDYLFDYFSYKTLEKSYLLKNKDNKTIERIQDLIMRVSLGIHGEDIDSALESYIIFHLLFFIYYYIN